MGEMVLLGIAVSTAALLAAASGPIFRVSGAGVRPLLGWSNALAAGLMLGAAFAVALEGWGGGPGLGFALLAPFFRQLVKNWLKRRFEAHIRIVFPLQNWPPGESPAHDEIIDTRVVDGPSEDDDHV